MKQQIVFRTDDHSVMDGGANIYAVATSTTAANVIAKALNNFYALFDALEETTAECEEYATIAKPPVKRRVKRVAREAREALAEVAI